MRRSTAAHSLVVIALLAASPASAFVLQGNSVNGQLLHPRWPLNKMPIHFRLNDEPFTLLHNLASDSMPLAAIQAAMQTWSTGPIQFVLDGTTPATSIGEDGINLITFANTPQNRTALGGGSSAAHVWWRPNGRQLDLVEADIILSSSTPFATDGRTSAFDIQRKVTRMLGYALGLDDSPDAAAQMFPFEHMGEAPNRTLSTDDIAGLRALYGLPDDPGEGEIAGQVVTESGAPVFGAHVTAIDGHGIVQAGALTEMDGSFTIPSLPAGSYELCAEPLDGPLMAGYLSPGYRLAQHRFQTAFAGGNLSAAMIAVSAGQTTVIDPISVVTQPARVKLEFIAWSPDDHSFRPAYPQALPIHPGESGYLEVAGGVGLTLVKPTGFAFSGGGVTIDPQSFYPHTTSAGTPYVVFRVTVPPDVPLGPRSLYATVGGERAVFTGALDVVAP